MKVGDLVETIGGPKLVGIIVKIEKSIWTDRWRYWVKLADKDVAAYPFLEKQIKVISPSLPNK